MGLLVMNFVETEWHSGHTESSIKCAVEMVREGKFSRRELGEARNLAVQRRPAQWGRAHAGSGPWRAVAALVVISSTSW